MVQDTFRRFAEDEIRPLAEEIHRRNLDIPECIIRGLAELGTFGVSIPEEHGGFAASGEGEYLAMVVVTEELSRGSLGVAGSLITRPEILARALLAGGTEKQKHHWLPLLASGEIDGRDRGNRARFRVRRRGPQDQREARWRWLADQRGEDVVHVCDARGRVDAAGSHRP